MTRSGGGTGGGSTAAGSRRSGRVMRWLPKSRRQCTKFRDLPPGHRALLLVLAAVQFGLLAWAEVDLQRRQADEVRGRKNWWRVVCLLNFIGPLSYLRWGRRW